MKIYKYHYVYRISNIVTGYHYYGSKSCNELPKENIGIKYFSSSTNKLFIQDQKNNPQDYKYKIIKIFKTTREDAINLESDLHYKFDVKNHPKFINKSNQTKNGFDTTGTNLSENHKAKISKFHKGKKDSLATRLKKSESLKGRKIMWRDKLSESRKGISPWNKGKKLPEFSGINNSFYGKSHTIETKKMLSDASKNQWKNYSEYEKNSIIKKRSKSAILNGSQKGKNNPQAKIYKVTSPSNVITICDGTLRDFCIDNNLTYDCMLAISKGKFPKSNRSKHFGWKVEKISN